MTYDANGYIATITDEEGRITSLTRDAKGRPTQIKEATGTADERITTVTWHATLNVPVTIVQPGLTTAYAYNTSGQLISRTETDTTTNTLPYPTSGQKRIWNYTYFSNDLLQSIDGPLPGTGDSVSYTYDASGNISTFTDEVGHVYTVVAVNGRGLPTQIKDPNDVAETLTYDGRGRLLTDTVDPLGLNAQTSLSYDAAGNIASITLADGSQNSFEYDGNDRVTKLTAKGGQSVSFSYDAMGNVTLSETRNAGGDPYFRVQSVFDELGRLLNSVRAGSASWTYGYDKVGNLLSVTDPNSQSTASTYDKLNRLVKFADERGSATNWTYGPTDAPVSATDPRSIVTSYVRNGWGEAIQETSNDIGTFVYERNPRGSITKRTDGRGVVANFTYDNLGRMLTASYPSETAANVSYTYDTGVNGKGRLTGVTDAAGTMSRTYDALGRVTAETRVMGSKSYSVSYQWNKAGKVTAMTYPSGRIVSYGRDSDGHVENVHTKASAADADVGLAWWVSYTPFGPRHGLLHGNALTDWRTYDGDRRLVTQTLRDESASPPITLLDRSYGYTDNRNLTAITDNLDAGRNESYWYTANGFLQNADGPWGALTFYIDGVGNVTHKILINGSATTTENYGYPSASNRINGAQLNGTASRTIVSDASGNIITDTDLLANVTKTLAYHAAGQLASVKVGSQVVGQYGYDYLSRLSIRTLPPTSKTLHTIHDLWGNIIAEYDAAASTPAREHAWLDERPLAVFTPAGTSATTVYHVHTDQLEHPIMMTDANKNVVWRATYLPFGGVHSITGSASLDQRFPGQWFQLESGLHYNWHRHYDPTTGRYVQPDPLGIPDGPSRWAYAGNSPLMNVDPEGQQKKRPPVINCVGVGQDCGRKVRPPGINPDYPNVCEDCLCRIGEWPYSQLLPIKPFE